MRKAKIEYRAEPAEKVSLATNSVDRVTAATAVHWFDQRAFWAEARRVLKPQGVVAVWLYSWPLIDPQIDRIVRELAEGVLSDYWPLVMRVGRNGPHAGQTSAAWQGG